MLECDDCGDDVDRVLRYRAYAGTTTHRTTRWLCRDCHPVVPERAASGSSSDSTPKRGTGRAVTDGGVSTACPDCAATTVNVHGIRDCVACHWRSH